MNCGEFTDNEIREELAHLGYHNVPQDKLEDFKKDLMKLILTDRSKSNSLNSSRTTEPEKEVMDSRPQYTTAGLEAEEDFSNHANQWIGSRLNEDWQYHGEKESHLRPQTAPEHRGRQRRERESHSYHDFEPLPSTSLDRERNQSHKDDVSESGSESRFIKRKTSRKTANGRRQIDESFADSESGVYEIYEKIKNLAMRECECGKTRPKSGDVEPPYRIKDKAKKVPSVIKRQELPPHTRNLIRTNMFERLKMYREIWKAQPPIGECDRLELRKSVHSKMMKRDEIKLKPKVYIPNLYIPPHEKKRLDVRWSVRRACENYELPPHGFYHEI